MITLQLLTPWTGAGTEDDPFIPLAAVRCPLQAWRDVSGGLTPAEPNLVMIEALATPETLAALEADPAFYILWSAEL